MNHTASDIIQLEKLQRKICRQIQGLPDKVANVATYSLLGVEPIEAVIAISSWYSLEASYKTKTLYNLEL